MVSDFDAVVISDLHLGARNARSDDFLRFLDWVDTPRLIVAGDIFDRPNLTSLGPRDMAVLAALRDFGRQQEVVWLRGNHDPSLELFSALLAIDARDELLVDVGPQTYLVCHGHEWDPSMRMPSLIVDAADGIYRLCQIVDPSHGLARRLKHRSKRFVRAVDSLRRGAVAAARSRALAGVILGHTHVASETWIDGVHYLNSGCWTERPSGFVGIRGNRARRYFWESISRGPRARRRAVQPFAAPLGVALEGMSPA